MARRLFDQEGNRLFYGEQLVPEPGYSLDFAVGMTYSLDLNAFLGIPISLGMLDDLESTGAKNPFYLLEAIRNSSDRIAVFCNAGSIHTPKKSEPVHILLEQSIFQVALGPKTNFHPKVWVIRYRNSDDDTYIRVVALSRNITFDRCFDIAASLTGEIGNMAREVNRPLSDLLKFVSGFTDPIKRKLIRSVADDVLKVREFVPMECFDSVEFLPFGIPGYKKTAGPEFSGARSLILVSPFLSDGVVKALTASAKQAALITRKTSVTPTVLSSFQDVFVTKELVLGNDLLEEGEPEETPQRDIHAKIFFEERDDGKYLYLGSLNASANAFYHNVEFMLKLRYRPYYASFAATLIDLVPEEQSPFERIETMDELPEAAEQEDPADLQDIVYAVKQAEVTRYGTTYTVRINCGDLESPCEIALFGASSVYQKLTDKVIFEKIPLSALSEFYIIRRGKVSTIIKIPTDGIPAEDRDNAIYSAIIGDRRGFLRYVSFLLADNYAETSLEEQMLGVESENKASASASFAGVYEQLLRTAAENPERLAAVENMMNRLNPEIVDERFRTLISACQSAAKQVKHK
jgi:hypothetical protein